MGREVEFGAFLRHWRKERGMKLTAAAAAAGVSVATWNHWETGRRQPRLDNLYNLAQLLEIPPQCFVCLKHADCIVVREIDSKVAGRNKDAKRGCMCT